LTWGNTKTNNSLVNHTSVFQGLDEAWAFLGFIMMSRETENAINSFA
jgi:hypothetical protein